MTTHAIVNLKINAPDKLNAYREHAAQALAKHGGALVQTSIELNTIEGTSELPDAMAILSFPDKNAAMAWINDPELAHVHNLRRQSGASTITLL